LPRPDARAPIPAVPGLERRRRDIRRGPLPGTAGARRRPAAAGLQLLLQPVLRVQRRLVLSDPAAGELPRRPDRGWRDGVRGRHALKVEALMPEFTIRVEMAVAIDVDL